MSRTKKKRGKERVGTKRLNGDFSDNFRDFKSLFVVLLSHEGKKPLVLKKLYSMLDLLSSEAQWSFMYSVGSHDFNLEMCHGGIKVRFEDICELFNLYFMEFEERFEQCFSKLCDISDKDVGECSSLPCLYDDVEVLIWLFRCCLLMLTLLADRVDFILEKGQTLFRILTKVSLPNLVENTARHSFVFEKSVSHKFPLDDNGWASFAEKFTASLHFLEPHDPLFFLKTTMLEVLVDELLMHEQLIAYFKKIYFSPSSSSVPFYLPSGDIRIVIEAICNHFILTFSDKQEFGDFMGRLFCLHSKELRYPFRAVGVTAARSLLHSPIINSAPKFMQAHVISLVSEVLESVKLNQKLIYCFLPIFEKSVNMYRTQTSWLQKDSDPSYKISYSFFESHVPANTKNKVDRLINELDNSPNPNIKSTMKSDLVSSSMKFVKECQSFYDVSFKDEILAILSCLILKASESFDDTSIHSIECTDLQNIYLLASSLKLMSMSLLQAVSCLRHDDDCLKTLKDFSSCKEYDFILGTIARFRDFYIILPSQHFLSDLMPSQFRNHIDSKMAFLHFSGLMSLSFSSGLDCLVKGCLLMIIPLLNLFVFEEGSLDALQSMVDSQTAFYSARPPIVRLQEVLVEKRSSFVVASKFQKTRSLHLSVIEKECNEMVTFSSETIPSTSYVEPIAALLEESEEASNGEIFFKCIGEKPLEYDDLLSFVECNDGFPAWYNKRHKYRKHKLQKMAVLRWKKTKKSWRTLIGKKKLTSN